MRKVRAWIGEEYASLSTEAVTNNDARGMQTRPAVLGPSCGDVQFMQILQGQGRAQRGVTALSLTLGKRYRPIRSRG